MAFVGVLRQFLNEKQNIYEFLGHHRNESILVAAALVSWVVIYVIYQKRKGGKYPPGPWGLPVVGYLPFMGKNPHLKLTHLKEKYGDVFSLRLGSKNVVVVSSPELLREAYSKDEFNGRPPNSAFTLVMRKSPFFTESSDVWKEHRRFVLQSMKDLGLGKTKIEGKVMEEIESVLDILKASGGRPLDLNVPLTSSMSNNIAALVFGERYQYNDPERKLLDRNLNEGSRVLGQLTLPVFLPWAVYIPGFLKWMDFKKGIDAFRTTSNLLWKKIQAHKETLDSKNPRDYIDHYFIELEARKRKDFNTTFSLISLLGTVTDLFGAGSETVRTAVLWCVYIMATYPDVQKKIQAEIQEVIGTERCPEFMDMRKMPYTHASILEVLRWRTIVPLNVLRYSVEDATLGGFNIPKGTIIMGNFWAVHHNPKLWLDPDRYIPERFLESDGKAIKKPPNYMPFSVGKRTCPGEGMAYMEIFLYFTSILQKFDIRFPEGWKSSNETFLGIAFKPEPYTARFIPRQN